MIIKQSLLGAQDSPLRMITTGNKQKEEYQITPVRPEDVEDKESQKQD